MRSLVEGSTRRVWIRNEVTVNPRNFTIACYYMTLMQSSSGHCIINVFFFLFFFWAMQHAASPSSATKTLEASKFRDSSKESPRRMRNRHHSV